MASKTEALIKLVSQSARGRWPEPAYLMTSDVAWRLPFCDPKDIRLWKERDEPIAFAWFTANDILQWSCPETRDDIRREMLDWAIEKTRGAPAMNPWLLDLTSMQEWAEALMSGRHLEPSDTALLHASVFDSDLEKIEWLERHEFRATNHTAKHLKLAFDHAIAPPVSEDGTVFRHVDDSELEKRCELHRQAWLKSTFSLEQYLQIRKSPIYEPTLDVVSVDPSGNFGSYCIGWVDQDMKVGSFEPVGTHEDHRNRGLAEKVIQETLRRMQAMGMRGAKISTAGFNEPAFNLYRRCGFEFTDLERTYVKVID